VIETCVMWFCELLMVCKKLVDGKAEEVVEYIGTRKILSRR
jgi:hypothetical protein